MSAFAPDVRRRAWRNGCVAALALASAAFSFGHDEAGSPTSGGPDKLVMGEAGHVGGQRITTWAVLTSAGKIAEVGVTIPLKIFLEQPPKSDGPSGAIASLQFPDVVREATFLNHIELHSNALGHPGPPFEPNRYFVPHFDFHFYSLPEAVVWGIPAAAMPLPPVPADRLPAGWFQPGPSDAQMGRHSVPATALQGPFTVDMIAGFLPSGSRMHFIEPMMTTAFLAKATSFEIPVPRPAVFGRVMLYPEKFSAEYDHVQKAYHFIFRQFVTVE